MASIYKRGKIYWARAERDGRDLRRSLKTTNRTIAEKRLGEWVTELDHVAAGGKPKRTFEEAATRFVNEHLPTLKPGAAKRYGVSLQVLTMHLGSLSLDQISSGKLADFEAARRLDGVTSGTIRRDLACLSSMLTSAEDWEWIDIGGNIVPAYLRRRSRRGLKEAPPRTRYLTEAEEGRLLREAAPDVAIAIQLAIDTGLRREELFSLTWGQVNMTRGIIATTTDTKSKRSRSVPLPPRSAQNIARLPRWIDCKHVLVNPDTGNRYMQMNKGLAGAVRRARLPHLCWHDLRRTAGCRWLQRDGRSMEEVSILLGHSGVDVTQKCYAFLDGETVAQSVSTGRQAHGE